MTPTPILATKLHIPRSRGQIVPRPHLIERLDDSLYRNLTLVSAPAGFGKSTLVSTWAAGCDRPVAWLSLDDDDNDQTRFLSYVIAALQTIFTKHWRIGAGCAAIASATADGDTCRRRTQ